jgi:hypothetical protein
MRIAESFLNIREGMSDDAAIFLPQGFDFSPEVGIELDLFQSKRLGLNRPLTRVIFPAAMRLACRPESFLIAFFASVGVRA